jgi:hypothetical protein
VIRVSMEVREGAALSRATVRAESILEAVSITRERYPGRDVRVIFPIDAEDFFIEDPAEGNSWASLSIGRSSVDKGERNGPPEKTPGRRNHTLGTLRTSSRTS